MQRKGLGVLRVSLSSIGCGNGGGGGERNSRVAMESTWRDAARDGDVDPKLTVGGGVEDVYGEDRATEDQTVTPWATYVARFCSCSSSFFLSCFILIVIGVA